MAISYTRVYDLILDDISSALETVPHFYEAFEMNDADWQDLSPDERAVCIRTLADDLFYVLGADKSAQVGDGSAEYDPRHGVIKISAGDQLVHVVPLRE